MPLAGSEPSVRSRGRASHEDCCAAARDPTGIGRAGSELPARASPSLRNLAVPRGDRAGTPCVREAAPPPSVPRESADERARIQRAREREEERERERREREIWPGEDSDGRRKSEIAQEGGRDRDEEERGREERERAPPPPPSGSALCPPVCVQRSGGRANRAVCLALRHAVRRQAGRRRA